MSNLVLMLAERLNTLKLQMACAESCTGGMIAARCTDLAGSSAWFDRGFVTYSNEAKTQMLGVPAELITTHGAVSSPVAHAMALGLQVSCTGFCRGHWGCRPWRWQPGKARWNRLVWLVCQRSCQHTTPALSGQPQRCQTSDRCTSPRRPAQASSPLNKTTKANKKPATQVAGFLFVSGPEAGTAIHQTVGSVTARWLKWPAQQQSPPPPPAAPPDTAR